VFTARYELLVLCRRSVWRAELQVAVTFGSPLLNSFVLDTECCDVTTTDWEESNLRVKLNLKNASRCRSIGHI
jgi:hypothetical protein